MSLLIILESSPALGAFHILSLHQGRIQGGAKAAIAPPPLGEKKGRGEGGRKKERKKNNQFE